MKLIMENWRLYLERIGTPSPAKTLKPRKIVPDEIEDDPLDREKEKLKKRMQQTTRGDLSKDTTVSPDRFGMGSEKQSLEVGSGTQADRLRNPEADLNGNDLSPQLDDGETIEELWRRYIVGAHFKPCIVLEVSSEFSQSRHDLPYSSFEVLVNGRRVMDYFGMALANTFRNGNWALAQRARDIDPDTLQAQDTGTTWVPIPERIRNANSKVLGPHRDFAIPANRGDYTITIMGHPRDGGNPVNVGEISIDSSLRGAQDLTGYYNLHKIVIKRKRNADGDFIPKVHYADYMAGVNGESDPPSVLDV